MDESAAFSAEGMNGLANHFVLISRNVGTTRAPEIENTMYVGSGYRAGKITCHEAAKILCERYAEMTRAPARTSLHLIVEHNLRS
jgi:hypothetical protein